MKIRLDPPLSKGEGAKIETREKNFSRAQLEKNSAFLFPSLKKRGQERF
jgi:hypothetical protein